MAATSPNKRVVIAALAILYFVWGSTYLAIRFGLEGFPPFLLNGTRFLIAGALMFLILRKRFSATRTQIVNAAKIGTVLLIGGTGLVTLAEQAGIGSAVAATAIAVTPVWIGISSGLFGDWPGRREWAAAAVGLVGVLILAREGDFQASPLGLALIIVSPMIWSFASVWGTKVDLPDPLSNTAIQLLAGGVSMGLLGLVIGERITEPHSAVAWAGVLYLATFGSLLAYTAFIYLMHTVRPALATSYAYVNPIVAVVLGVTLGGESLTGAVFFALPLILASVALVATRARGKPTRTLDPQPLDQAA